MTRMLALTVTAFGFGVAAAFALLNRNAGEDASALIPPRPVWTEVQWPFPMDQWGGGKAFRCKPADCGTEVNIYLRAKLGSCDCTAGVADDAALDRMGDLELFGGAVLPLGSGRPITIGWMNGRSRAYTLAARAPPGKTAISVAFSDRCDMVVATTVLPHDRVAAIEPAVAAFLNGRSVLRWVEVTLGI